MNFPILTLLLTLVLSCGGGSRGTSDETAVAATSSSAVTATATTSIDSLNSESTTAVGLYVGVLTGGANLALTSFATSEQAQYFQSLVVDAIITANAHTSTDPRAIHTAAHNAVVEAAIKAGIHLSPPLVVKFTQIAMEYGKFSKEDMEALLRASLLKANFPKDEIRMYIAEFMKLAPESFGENLAQAMVAVTRDHMPPEEVLATIANNAHLRPGSFGDQAVAGTVASAQALGLSRSQLASLLAAVDTTSASATENAQIHALLEELVATVNTLSVAAAAAASRGSSSSDTTPGVLALAYDADELLLAVGVEMTPEDPADGTFTLAPNTTITSCEFSDLNLPDGLEIDNTSCVISGTPTTVSATATYTITVTDSNGVTTTDTIDITIVNKTPVLAYSSDTISATQGVAITPEDPADGTFTTGGAEITITNCTVTPDLPTGLSLNTTTCVISGTTSDSIGTATYTVTVTNSLTLTATDTIDITISAPAFSTSLDLSSAGNFNCDGAGSCATNNSNITISGGTASATSTDRKKNTDTEWNATGATLDNVTASSNSLVLNGTTNAAWTMSADWTPQWNNIFIYYNFEEAAGNASNIANPGTNDGVLTNGATREGAAAKAGGAGITLDGNNDYVETNYSLSNTEPHDLTLMGWYKMADLGTSKGTLMGSRNGAQVFEVFVDGNDSGKLELFIQNGSTWRRVNSTTANLDDDAWHHYAITYGNGGTLRVYIDGNLEPSTTVTGYNTLSVPALCVGCYNYWGTRQDQWAGSVDEFAIWKNDLTAAEVSLIYQRQKVAYSGIYTSEIMDLGASTQIRSLSWNTSQPFGKAIPNTNETSAQYSGVVDSAGATGNDSKLNNNLLAYYNFDGDVASSITDRSGNSQNSTLIVNTLTSEPGIIGKAARFGDGHAELGNMDQGGAISVSVWIHPDRDFVGSSNETVVAEGEDGEWDLQYTTVLGGNRLRLAFHNGTTWHYTNNAAEITAIIPNSEWTHIVAIRDSSLAGNDYLIYVNGKLDVSSSFRDGDTIRDESGGVLTIGGWNNNSRRFKGLIDELGIWNRALDAAEVLELYRRGANKISMQIRSCNDSGCSGESWVGPTGGSYNFFTEVHNSTGISSDDPSGDLRSTQPFNLFSDFSTAPSANQYFQYRVIAESLDTGSACSGSTCYPDVVSVSLHDRVSDAADGAEIVAYNSGYFVNATAVTYSTLTSIVIADSGTCTYQFSPDNGSTFYYHNGSAWTTVSSDANAIANDHASLSSISGFPAGTQLVIKAFTGSACSITGIQVNGTN